MTQATTSLPCPQKIFIGGSGGELSSILDLCWESLDTKGKLVVACVTENNKSNALSFAESFDTNPENPQATVEVVQISVSRGDSIANQLILRPLLPVLLISITKIRH